jgi:hypothetical protein
VTYVEVERISGNIEVKMTTNTTDGEDLTTGLTTGSTAGSHAQTADFTTAPDQIGIQCVNNSADFEWFVRLL